MIRSRIIGSGSYLPSKILTNNDLTQFVDTTHEWIVERTGISQRHVAAEGEVTSDMGAAAAKEALKNAGIVATDLDMIIVATTTPDRVFPSTAVYVQEKIGAHHCPVMDLNAACSGFVYALSVADQFIKTGQCKNILVIGAEMFSSLIDWSERTTAVLFGDGAGAVVVRADQGAGTKQDHGIFASELYADGTLAKILHTTGGTASTKNNGVMHMDGKEVFRHAVLKLSAMLESILNKAGFDAAEVDWLVPHQANKRIIDAMGKKLGLGEDKVIITVDHHANTSAASIPLAFHEGISSGRIKPGQVILMEGLGAGLTWGSVLFRL